MENISTTAPGLARNDERLIRFGADHSGVSWGAIFAGAAGAAALSLILAILGFGFGMSAISPWANAGASAKTIGISSVVWVILTQLAAAGLGGYLAGRLRIKWTNVHNDEVYFRDTAHGFLAWALATLATAALFATTVGAIVDTGAKAGAAAVSGVATAAVGAAGAMAADEDGGLGYTIDRLLRPSATATPVAPAPINETAADGTATPAQSASNHGASARRGDMGLRGETMRIFASALKTGTLNTADSQYLATQVAARTDISQQEAEVRIREAFDAVSKAATEAKEAADQARKAAAHTALWLFVSLLGGAFFASFMATYGGRRRDGIA